MKSYKGMSVSVITFSVIYFSAFLINNGESTSLFYYISVFCLFVLLKHFTSLGGAITAGTRGLAFNSACFPFA